MTEIIALVIGILIGAGINITVSIRTGNSNFTNEELKATKRNVER